MYTLSNVEHQRGDIMPPCIDEYSFNALPEVFDSKGVSVRYVHDTDKKWFALRATYGREDIASKCLLNHGVYSYIAKRYVKRRIGNKTRLILKSLIPNMVFAYATDNQAKQLVRHTPELSFLEFYYNRLDCNADGFNPPLVIPEREMENFILATCSHNEHLLLVTPERCHYRNGDSVRVADGLFRGVEGRVARVAGQQRVVIELTGIGLVTTAYIPTAFLEPVERQDANR
ncbi:MAG: UpxY family transcription antiterminator [Muribaculaceae bacterium]|nr:UpxY family transcription antiterminator [Muribaculaceae bacterium]